MSVSLAELQQIPIDDRWMVIDCEVIPVHYDNKCKPDYIGPLYRNIPMPHYTVTDGTSITLDDDNIFNGTLIDKDETDNVTMSWKGYTCQLYDGELKMSPINDTATITGTCNGIAFAFDRTELIFGCWPGFLSLYKCVP
jgi:hypothetical protein